MSPAGGVGINLAIQDAVATANLLAEPLRQGRVTEALLARVQQRREFPTRVTQRLQVNAHKLFEVNISKHWSSESAVAIEGGGGNPGRAWAMGYVVGIGVRPEHVAGAARQEPYPEWSVKTTAIRAGALLGSGGRDAKSVAAAAN